jgi:hypothetical protein
LKDSVHRQRYFGISLITEIYAAARCPSIALNL